MSAHPEYPCCSFCNLEREFYLMSCSHLICVQCKPANNMLCPLGDKGIIAPEINARIREQCTKVWSLASTCKVPRLNQKFRSTLEIEKGNLEKWIEEERCALKGVLRKRFIATPSSLRSSWQLSHVLSPSLIVPLTNRAVSLPQDPSQAFCEVSAALFYHKVQCSCGFSQLSQARLTETGIELTQIEWTCPGCAKQYSSSAGECASCRFVQSTHVGQSMLRP